MASASSTGTMSYRLMAMSGVVGIARRASPAAILPLRHAVQVEALCRQAVADQLLDRRERVGIPLANERDRGALTAHSSRTADPVNVRLRVLGNVVVDDV